MPSSATASASASPEKGKGSRPGFLRAGMNLLRESSVQFFRTMVGIRQKRRSGHSRIMDDPLVYKPVLYAISTTLVFRALAANIVTSARVELMLKMHKGNASAAALALGKIRATGAFVEFLIGPMIGKLSDAYGRRVIMTFCSFVSACGTLLVQARPYSLWVHWLTQIPSIAFSTAYFASMRAQMADVMSGRNIAENAFMHMAPAGFAMIGAPMMAARLTTMQCYRVSSLSMVLCVWILYNQEETLSIEDRRPVDWSSCNPFSFFKIFASGPTLRTLALTSGIQTYTDSRLMDNLSIQTMRQNLNWGKNRIDRQLTWQALSGFLGVPYGKLSIKRFGRIVHTHYSHVFKLIAYYTWANATNSRQLRLVQLILLFGQRQRDGTETLITDVAIKKGFGKGEIESYKMNWRSVSNMFAPIIYSRSFSYGKTVGKKALPFYSAMALTLLSEVVLSVGMAMSKGEAHGVVID